MFTNPLILTSFKTMDSTVQHKIRYFNCIPHFNNYLRNIVKKIIEKLHIDVY